MKTDTYTKIMLTLIAIGLWGILLKPLFITEPVVASNGIMDVNVQKIAGRSVDKRTLNVNIRKVGGFNVTSPDLPVKTK
jgi:hypothetical protein